MILPGETLTITLLNCEDWYVEDESALGAIMLPGPTGPVDSFTVPSDEPSYVITVDDEADIDLDGPDSEDIDIDVYFATPGADPTGSLIVTTRVTMPIVIDDFAIDLASVGFDTTLGGVTGCEMEAGYHPYVALPIAISTAGDFTFRVIDVTPVDEDVQWGQPYYPSQDLFLAVYTSFDPDNPADNLVACNDDRPLDNVSFLNDGTTYISDDQAPEFVSALGAGGYTLVLTTYRSTSSADWAAGQFSTWSGIFGNDWEPTAMTALFELWGPTGSITIVDPEPELAATGARAEGSAALAVAAALLLAAGGGLALARRRAAAQPD